MTGPSEYSWSRQDGSLGRKWVVGCSGCCGASLLINTRVRRRVSTTPRDVVTIHHAPPTTTNNMAAASNIPSSDQASAATTSESNPTTWEYYSSGCGDWDNSGNQYAELDRTYWFQLADTYNVGFAISRVHDLRSGKFLLLDLLHTMIIARNGARPALARLAREFTVPEDLQPPALAPLQRLVALTAPPGRGVSIDEWLEVVEVAEEEPVAYIMAQHTGRESRATAAHELEEVLMRVVALADEGIARVWEVVESGGVVGRSEGAGDDRLLAGL